MRKSKLKSTTSLVVSLALVATPMFAQEVDIQVCADEPEFPCLSVDGDLIEDREEFDEMQQSAALEAVRAQMEAELAAAVAAEAEAAAEAAVAAQAAVDAEQEAADAAENAEADAAAQAQADAEAAQAQAAEAAAAQAAAEQEAQAAAAALADAEADAAAAAEAVAAAEAQAAADAETQADEEAAAEAAAAAEDEAAAAAEAEAAAEADLADADAEAEAQAAAEAEAVEAAEAAAEAEAAEAEELADEVVTEAPAIITEPATLEEQLALQSQTPEETVEEAPIESGAAMADLDEEVVAEDVIVETETVTEADVRSSTEDFSNRVNAEQDPVVATNGGRDGLSTFQKALLVGLGAAVVGTVLRNGDRVVSNSGDRVVVQRGDNFVVLKDDDVLLRQPGSQVETQTFSDGSTRTIVQREDGSRIITIRGSDGTVQRRARVMPDGTQVELFNDTIGSPPVIVSQLPPAPVQSFAAQASQTDLDALREALFARDRADFGRTFSLNQVRTITEVRNLVPVVELDTLTFASGSAAIDRSQTEGLTNLGLAMSAIIANDPSQVFLVEGHTDAVGSASMNLALSDRRAETVALALAEFFGVPPENLITQGYGESFLKVPTLEAERANRRVAIRNISSLLR